ncbi:hypothetical protein [Streptococcus mutans]|uniref:hypothetical protein n=1 Tax=Streptococcus mutans TaxID=1309 RepID=UPI000E00AF57|nr:hypothetical protein [Streptococcus mutans]NLR27661.1 hypothetical protein [Streptococcus mutans]QIQ93117.1 hypothetical protein HB753_00745 [Streptococcus mutans]QIQ99358.1 hypothetical protein HB752_00745 [Streptococcus mutans]QIR02835.1 hypothetical protein HB751_09610 [Streptococcus mutans]QIR03137.1 hypothetical protein HB750_00745 [Streptococcus mutans]
MVLKFITTIAILLNALIVRKEIKELYFLKTRIRVFVSLLLLTSYFLAASGCLYELVLGKEIKATGFLTCIYIFMLLVTSSFQSVYYDLISESEEPKKEGEKDDQNI